ncbi:hypothetical protein WJX73_001662 [Symbiochloris irregularis]|uniref:Peptidase S9 prolyl oligopeptidase catalytic domain-containing protein n=1 Tax=Symbiochloris irregularis TaxID=706552 RepID=A0AAW1NR65_9CHLO
MPLLDTRLFNHQLTLFLPGAARQPELYRCLAGRSLPIRSAPHRQSRYQTTTVMAAEAPVGGWNSPITSELITSKSIRLGAARAGPDGLVYWLEGRPTEGGRSVLVRRNADGKIEDVTPPANSGFNVRTRVHEYGGGEYCLGKDAVYFSNFKDQRLYKQTLGKSPQEPKALTPESGAKLRYADAVVDEARGRLIAVQEDHTGQGEAKNNIAAIDIESGKATVLVSGQDFYSNPRLSPDGTKLAWVCWDHPNMPWDDTFLYSADVAKDGSLSNHRKVAGGKDESTLQPVWLPSDDLVYISDRTGWWNLYLDQGPDKEAKAILPLKAEFGSPNWVFGIQNYAALPDGRLVAIDSDPQEAGAKLMIVSPETGKSETLKAPYSSFGSLTLSAGHLVTVGGSPTKPGEVCYLEIKDSKPGEWVCLQKSTDLEIDVGYLSAPEAIEFPTENGKTAFMNYYAPKNKDFKLPSGEKPPLLVKIHGGPTAQASTGFNLALQFWTSRGASHYGVADCGLLAQETHKFESRYLDSLIGPYPQEKATYDKRSPINSIDQFSDPIIFFQGTEDEVVPPNQAQIMYDNIKAKGIPTALVMFEGEQHGFRGSIPIRRALEGELHFYGEVLGFKAPMSPDLEGFDIANLKK